MALKMNDFSKMDLNDRKAYIQMAAGNSGFPVSIIEKDFWVCWTLERLFSLKGIGSHLIFKGGTTLSKVYSVIERFSEDVDISIDREKLGFVGDRDPEKAMIEELATSCKIFVQNELYTNLCNAIDNSIMDNANWNLVTDEDDSDGQTLLFHYPTIENSYGDYIKPSVKIEIGARSDHWPAHQHLLTPYLHEYLPVDTILNYKVAVNVLDVARTFWEKATILHMYAYWPENKLVASRQSRHYYDFFKLLSSDHTSDALSKLDLLTRVSKHKQIYFRSGWAKYDQAKPGTLKLIPPSYVKENMRKDYHAMQEMIFKAPPTWDEIIVAIDQFEKKFNIVQP
jgi:hypothetical protein